MEDDHCLLEKVIRKIIQLCIFFYGTGYFDDATSIIDKPLT